MLEALTRLVQPIVPIRRGEWRKSILMFLYFGITISTLYILKPVKDSLYLTVHGAENLWIAYMGEGFFLFIFTLGYIQFSKQIAKKNILFSIATAFFAINIFFFWVLFKLGFVKWLAYFFYVWVAAYSITIVTQCWTLANDIFNPQEAKRLFGFIVSGGSLGGILGGLLTNRFAERIGSENLLLLSGALLCVCIYLINTIWKYEHAGHKEEHKETHSGSSHLRDKSAWKLFLASRYFILIAALVMIAKIASTVVDNQFKAVVEHAISGKDARTAFLGGFSAILNGISFFMQLVVASYSLRILGIGISLMLLPIGLSLGAGFSIFMPLLWVACSLKAYDGSMNYSINQLSKEILYLPVPSRTRYRVKPLIDMLGYRFSKTIAGGFIFLSIGFLGIPVEKLGILIFLLVPLWVMAAWVVRDEYVQSIKKLLDEKNEVKLSQKVRHSTSQILASLEGERSFDKLKALLNSKSSVTRKISAAALHAFYSGHDIQRVKKLVEEMMRYEAVDIKGIDIDRLFQEPERHAGFLDRQLADLLKAKQDPTIDFKALLKKEEKEILLKLSSHLANPAKDSAEKKKIILILTMLGTQGSVDILLNSLSGTKDKSMRFNLIQGLNRIKAKNERREFNAWILKKEVIVEVHSLKSIFTLIEVYKKRKSISQLDEDYLAATLEAMREESLERVFRLLSLLYQGDVIRIIYDRLTDEAADKQVKANALELLENVLEAELSRVLNPVLDDERRSEIPKRKLEEILDEFLISEDQWFSICAIFLIVELHLHEFYTKLKEIRSASPIVREAVEIAILKTEHKK